MLPLPISCFIIAKNEADRIARTIRSVKSWVDEVVVVDSESSDDTVAVALREGCRVITQPWLGFGGQKRFAEDQCRNNWILNLDADEVVTPQLKQEMILALAGGNPAFVAYGMPVLTVYPGDEKPRRWARDHVYVRLYDRRVVRFRNSEVHDTVVTDGHEVGRLHAAVYHYSMRSFADMSRKLDERMWLSVRVAEPCSAAKLLLRLPIEFPMNLLKYYIVRRHWTGGIKGLRFASIQARYRLLKVWRLWLRTMFGTPVPAVGPHEPISIDDDDRGGGGAQNLMRDGGAADGRQSRSTQFSPAPDNRIAAGELAGACLKLKNAGP
jgi:glycosyltransferase involved in cell wall biosynthesis